MAYFSTYSSDRRKAKREDERRWHDQVRSEIAEFLRACFDALEALSMASQDEPKIRDLVDGAIRAKKLKDATRRHIGYVREARASFDNLSIIAPKSIVDAASEVYGHVIQTAVSQAGAHPRTMPKHRKLVRKLIDTVRNEMGIKDS